MMKKFTENYMSYYSKKYFDWQRKAGMYGAQQDLFLYEDMIKKSDTVLDFGCGGGYMLEKIKCRSKYGVDINPRARKEVEKKGIKVFAKLSNLPDSLKFDVVISHHTLEHLENPTKAIKDIKKHIRKDGIFICVVPIDDWRIEKQYELEDINKHLYTWTPRLLGNLFGRCGYEIQNVRIIERAWIPLSRYYYPYIPKLIYNFASLLWSKLTLSRQIRIIVKSG